MLTSRSVSSNRPRTTRTNHASSHRNGPIQNAGENIKALANAPTRTFMMIIAAALFTFITFALYLITEIHLEKNVASDDIVKTNTRPKVQSHPNHDRIEDDKRDEMDPIQIAVDKSFRLYLGRDGHDDRVEYMIGFRGQRITNPKEYDRDYRTSPIQIAHWEPQPKGETQCDAHCEQCRFGVDCDVHGVRFSMENVPVPELHNKITGSVHLDSQVPVPYFSWHDFQFMAPLQSKSATALAAAFISNCSFKKRNKMVRDLQLYGVSVHSYGRCEHNHDEIQKGGKGGSKVDILRRYKFSLAFENSETDDYITEKFFGTLQSGSVPVYIGAPNVKFFAPDAGIDGPGRPWKARSVIYAGDFDFDAQRLAEYLLYLDGNETAYNELLRYKEEGYSGDFKAMVELTAATHTRCRQCILATDRQRYEMGVGAYDEVIMTLNANNEDGDGDGKWIYVRERGMYRFALIKLMENTMESLVESVLMAIDPKKVNLWNHNEHPKYDRIGPAVYGMYHIPSKHLIHSDVAIENLPDYAELEVIMV